MFKTEINDLKTLTGMEQWQNTLCISSSDHQRRKGEIFGGAIFFREWDNRGTRGTRGQRTPSTVQAISSL